VVGLEQVALVDELFKIGVVDLFQLLDFFAGFDCCVFHELLNSLAKVDVFFFVFLFDELEVLVFGFDSFAGLDRLIQL